MEASLFRQGEAQTVYCDLCHHRCHIKPGRRGLCHVRENRQGKLHTLVYGRLIARHVDPIEKNRFSTSCPAPGLTPSPR